jgi:hypothetical protein
VFAHLHFVRGMPPRELDDDKKRANPSASKCRQPKTQRDQSTRAALSSGRVGLGDGQRPQFRYGCRSLIRNDPQCGRPSLVALELDSDSDGSRTHILQTERSDP